MKERELKLALPGSFSIPPLVLGGEPLRADPLDNLTLRATYFDTADLRLARHGVTLRYRTGEDGGARWTLKLPQATSGAALERHELHFSGPARDVPAEARSLVTAYARSQALVAVATLRTRRRRMHLIGQDATEPLAELAIDEVSVVEGRRVVARFRELEVEDLGGVELDLASLSEQLQAAGATGSEPIPKVVRALGSRATAPPDVVMPAAPPDPTMADAVRVAIGTALVRLVEHDPLARLGDPEGVHQVRVAFRRLRSDLRTLDDAVDPEWRKGMEPRLRAASGAFGDLRDLDVLTDRLRRDADGVADALAPLFAHLARRQSAARAALAETLDGAEYAALLDELVTASQQPPIGRGGDRAAGEALPGLAMAAWRRLERRARQLRPGSPDAAFHRARIAAKRARYAAELAARLLDEKPGRGAEQLARRIAEAQDRLGALQDAAVAEAAIRAALEDVDGDAACAFEAGRLVERQRQHAREAREAFLKAWPGLRRAKWRSWAS